MKHQSMNKYKEIKEIAKCVAKMKRLVDQLEDKLDTDGIDWGTAEFVTLSKEDRRHFENTNGVTEDYYTKQYTGYLGDDYYGWLYFATDVPGQYVKVHFEM